MPNKKLPRREFLKLAASAAFLAGCRPKLPDEADEASTATTPPDELVEVPTGTTPPDDLTEVATSTALPNEPTTGPVDATLALVNGTVIDGTGADPLENATVLIDGDRIVAVGQNLDVPEGAQVIDVKSATILPGFINAHVHGGYDSATLKGWAQGGVTTVRDMGSSRAVEELFAFRDVANADPQSARLVAAGQFITAPQGYPIVPWGMGAITVSGADDARDKTTQLLDDGADVIKIALESGDTFGRKIAMLSPEEAAAIVETAHGRGKKVTVHITDAVDVAPALDAGVDDLAHMVVTELSNAQIRRVVKTGTSWVPTLELWKYVSADNPVSYDETAIDNLRRFVAAGGAVALGTDYDGYAAQFELGMPTIEIGMMAEAGMSPMQIIVAATKHAAEVCGLGDELGTLEAGKVADVLVVEGDPLEDVSALADVRLVIHEGVIVEE